jgi:hypothetical protein
MGSFSSHLPNSLVKLGGAHLQNKFKGLLSKVGLVPRSLTWGCQWLDKCGFVGQVNLCVPKGKK